MTFTPGTHQAIIGCSKPHGFRNRRRKVYAGQRPRALREGWELSPRAPLLLILERGLTTGVKTLWVHIPILVCKIEASNGAGVVSLRSADLSTSALYLAVHSFAVRLVDTVHNRSCHTLTQG
eukprot:scaffold113467_cov20-Tisochrysis_lutea.AAC.1